MPLPQRFLRALVNKNLDRSNDLYVTAHALKDFQRNCVQTLPGNYGFSYLRRYAPTAPYVYNRWKFDDITPVS